MADLSAKSSPPLDRWLDENAWEEPYHGQVEGRPGSGQTWPWWLHLDVSGQTLSLPERWITKRSSQSSSDATGVARDAPAADSRHHIAIASASVLSCRECAEQFTGIWREGSLARHLRLKHRSDLNVPYSCSVCHKPYARSDALLKHERRKHPELQRAPPAERKPRPSHSRSSSFETQGPSRIYPTQDLYADEYADEYYTQELLPVASSRVARPQHPSNHSMSPEFSGQHRLVVQTGLVLLASELENSLVPNASSLLDNNLVRRWEPIILQLRNRGSGLDTSFRNALKDIRALVRKNRTNNSTLVGSQPPSTSAAITSHTQTNGRNKSRTSTSRAGSSRALPRSNPRQLSQVRGHPNAANHSNCGSSVRVLEREDDSRLKYLDCPVYKHHVMQNLPSPCGGGKFTFLAGIRHHLQPSRSQTHGFPRFLKNCPTCNQEFVEEDTWIAHESHDCMHSTRRRTEDSKVESWARLYVALYPNTPCVPSPFSGERSWLSLDVSNLLPTYHRVFTPPDFNVLQTPSSLVDHQSSQNSTPIFTPTTRSPSQNVRCPRSSASTASVDPNYSPYSQLSPTDYPPQQNINTTSQAGYPPDFGNQTTNQTESSVAYKIIFRDAIALASRLYEEGERILPPTELKQLVDEIEDEFHFQLRPHGRNNMEPVTPVTPMTSTPGAPGHEDRTSVGYRPPYEHQSPLNNDDATYQMLQRNARGIPLPSTNYSASLTSELSSAPYYRPANYSSLQVPTPWETSPGHDSGYVSNRSDPSDQPRPFHVQSPLRPCE